MNRVASGRQDFERAVAYIILYTGLIYVPRATPRDQGCGGMEGGGDEKRRSFAQREALDRTRTNAADRLRSAERPINCRAYRFRSAFARGTRSVSDYL